MNEALLSKWLWRYREEKDYLRRKLIAEKYGEGIGNYEGSLIMIHPYSDETVADVAFEYGMVPGLALSAVEHYILKGRLPLTLKHGKPDHEATEPASLHSPIQYIKPDGVLSFDVPTSLYRSNTNHVHDQPAHLHLKDPTIPEVVNLPHYAGPETRYCPARVYEYVEDENGSPKLHINAQNCLHCKACDIKDPTQNIEWTVPEGGGGPGYLVM